MTASKTDPPILDPRLAAELRRLRRSAGVTGEAMAAALGWSPSKVSRLERGRFGIKRPDLDRWLRHLQVPAEVGQAVFALAANVAVSRFTIPGGHFAGAESATTVMDWSLGHVPWLLQVPPYTRDLLASRQPASRRSPAALRDFANSVGIWQERLRAGLKLRAVIAESVLYRLVGSDRVMRAQLGHLSRISAEAGHDVQVRVLSDDAGGCAVGYGSFTYLEYEPLAGLSGAPAVVTWQLDTPGRSDDNTVAWDHRLTFSHLWDRADLPAEAIARSLTDAWGDTE